MMTKSKAGLLAVLGAIFGIAVMAIFVVPKLSEPPAGDQVTSLAPDTGGEKDAGGEKTVTASDAVDSDQVASAGAGAADPKGSRPAVSAEPIVPSFDVLRFEPDGSAVIAGKGTPGSKLDIMNGEKVIASTQIGASGDFAVVLDSPLLAGDYELKLKTTDDSGASQMSEEVATVSIPEDETGPLLVMVTKPGEASRILSQPEVLAQADGSGAADATKDNAATQTQMASEEDADDLAPSVMKTEEAGAQEPAVNEDDPAQMAAAQTGGETAGDEQAGRNAVADGAAIDEMAANKTAPRLPDLPKMALDMAASAPSIEAAPAVKTAKAEVSQKPEIVITVRVDAVEIEGKRLFVAGSATPGHSVRVLADGTPIGTEKADENGRFIVEAETELSVGDHVIAAELIAPDTDDVLLRAKVPFNRPEGETMAAVASAAKKAAPAGEPAEMADAGTLGDEGEMANAGSTGDSPSGAEKAKISSGTPAAGVRVAEAIDAPGKDVPGEKVVAAEKPAQVVVNGEPAAGAANGADAAVPLASATSGSGAKQHAADKNAAETGMAVDGAQVSNSSSETAAKDKPVTIEQAPLTPTDGSVIIRRGDTLWQIARRTYGRGVRYTTIYLANQKQIEDPDLISPGQIFRVPEKALENAEELHRKLLQR